MKLKTLLFVCCLSLVSSVFADNRHVHPQAKANDIKAGAKNAMYPGFCEIEIINDNYDYVNVYGVFDDTSRLTPFTVYRYEIPHYISLYYLGYCHQGMDLDIVSPYGTPLFYGFARVGSTIRL